MFWIFSVMAKNEFLFYTVSKLHYIHVVQRNVVNMNFLQHPKKGLDD